MRSWLLACFMILVATASLAGPCAEAVRLPPSSILFLEQSETSIAGGAPWVQRLSHPTDSRITIDLGLADMLPAQNLDQDYLRRSERGALGGARKLYRDAGATILDSGLETTPRWAWWVTARKGNTIYHYRSDRFADGCALLAAVTMPASYERSGILPRLDISLDDLARTMVAQYGAPRVRGDRELPTGFAALMACGIPLLVMAIMRLVVWRLRLTDRHPIGLTFRTLAALPVVAACGAVAWSLATSILGRGKLENAEILLLVVVAGVWACTWIGARWQHIGALGSILIPMQTVNLIYMAMGWHWDDRHFVWLTVATAAAIVFCTLGFMKMRRDARLQLALDEAILDRIVHSAR